METLHARSTTFAQKQAHCVADTEVVDQGTEVSPKASIDRVGQVGSIGPHYYTELAQGEAWPEVDTVFLQALAHLLVDDVLFQSHKG